METNTLVKITAATIVIATNWISIGSFQDKAGRNYDVLQQSIMTNTVGRMESEGQTVEFVFKSIQGPTNNTLLFVPTATQTLPTNAPPPFPGSQRFIIIPAITNK